MKKTLASIAAVALVIALVIRFSTWDFAVSIVPGWHVPILAPYAIACILAGALVVGIVLAVLIRAASGGARGEGRRQAIRRLAGSASAGLSSSNPRSSAQTQSKPEDLHCKSPRPIAWCSGGSRRRTRASSWS
jgi:hypothetical protein